MKVVNKVLLLLIVILFSLVFVIRPLGAVANFTLAPAILSEAAEDVEETEPETELPYSADDFYELSHVIQAEAGYCDWDMMVGVGSVVLNRVKSDKFPNTVYEVIHQPGQYSTASYLDSQVPTQQVLDVTDYLLRNGSEYPADVLYQANFPQGSGTYLTLSTSYSTMYFCYQ